MVTHVVTVGLEELESFITEKIESAYSSGYKKAKAELESVKVEPTFNEVLKGVKELQKYLTYKGYWFGSVSTLNKVAYQLVEDGDRNGHTLLFRCGCIDHEFKNGFRFTPWKKKTQ